MLYWGISVAENHMLHEVDIPYIFLSFIPFAVTHEISAEVVITEPEVILQKGTRDTIPCEVNTDVDVGIVLWQKGSTLMTADRLVEISFLSGTKEKAGEGYKSGSYDIHDNYSLIIANVSVADNDNFFCEIVTVHNEIYNNQTNVNVFGKYATQIFRVYLLVLARSENVY